MKAKDKHLWCLGICHKKAIGVADLISPFVNRGLKRKWGKIKIAKNIILNKINKEKEIRRSKANQVIDLIRKGYTKTETTRTVGIGHSGKSSVENLMKEFGFYEEYKKILFAEQSRHNELFFKTLKLYQNGVRNRKACEITGINYNTFMARKRKYNNANKSNK